MDRTLSDTVTIERVLYPRDSELKGAAWRLVLARRMDGSTVKVTGNWPSHPLEGVEYDIEFEESHHAKHGYSWEINLVRLASDTATHAGLAMLVQARKIKGIGVVASRMIAELAFDHEPENPIGWLTSDDAVPVIAELPRVTEEMAVDLVEGIRETNAYNERYLELAAVMPGVRDWIIKGVLDHFGEQAREIVTSNPYQLLAVSGLGWQRVDAIATDAMEIEDDDDRRLWAAAHRAIEDAAHACGSTVCTVPQYQAATLELVQHHLDTTQWGLEIVDIDGDSYVVSPRHVAAEYDIAEALRERQPYVSRPLDQPDDLAATAGPDQLDAWQQISQSHTALLVGGPGTGKTWLTARIVEAARKLGPVNLAAPTGKAARRITEALSEAGVPGVTARTIHAHLGPRLFGSQWFDADRGRLEEQLEPLPGGTWIVDETSMADVVVFARLISEIPRSARVILVGDDGQLPSVDPGAVLRDLIESGRVPVARLETIRRNSGAIPIVCRDVRQGWITPDPFVGIRQVTGQANLAYHDTGSVDLADWIRSAADPLADFLGVDPIRDVQYVAAQRGGPYGVAAINAILQDIAHPDTEGESETGLRTGDRIVVGRNGTYGKSDVPLVNGEIGFVAASSPGVPHITFDFDGQFVTMDLDEVRKAKVQLAYCLTVHKMQGSGSPVIVYVAPRSHTYATTRELIYTALSRAERTCVVVGDWQTLERGVKKRGGDRETRLQSLIRDAVCA